jgi:hypothetical protein
MKRFLFALTAVGLPLAWGALLPARAATSAKEISFTREIQPLMVKCCVDCHGQKKARGGVRLETYADLMKHGKKGRPVIPGDPVKSRVLATHVGVKQHPEKHSRGGRGGNERVKAIPPTREQLALIEAWIAAGAEDDSPAKP